MYTAPTETQTKPEPIIKLAKATICWQGDFGMNYNTLQVRDLEVTICPYAQYSKAIKATFTPKGARRKRGLTQSYKPTLVVLDGHVDLSVPKMTRKVSESESVTLEVSRYHSFDDGWTTEFHAALAASGHKVVRDFHGHNSY